jgi:glucokinase
MIDVEELKAEHVFSAAKKGDDFALELVRNEGFYLGIGIANMASVFDPELIAIGGGLTRQWDMFYHQMMNTAKTRLFASKDIQVVKASLDSYAGLLGIAKLAWDFVDNSLKR